ncbi:hypothetical protein EIL50_00520 [bacterium NHP-B]|nr:hypothetical protein EIL50_00520 [bacterium NHP-B]
MYKYTAPWHEGGYDAPSTLAINSENPQLTLGDEQETVFHKAETMPSSIVLPVTLHGEAVKADPTITLIVDQERLNPAPLYRKTSIEGDDTFFEHGRYASLSLTPEGGGTFTWGTDTLDLSMLPHKGWHLAMPPLLFTKSFLYETQPVTETMFSSTDLRLAPATTGHILRPYGGFWGDTAATCTQIYYEILEQFPGKTIASLISQHDTLAHTKEKTVFSHPTLRHISTLHEDIMSGNITLTLQHIEHGYPVVYHSTHYTQEHKNRLTVTLTHAMEDE